MTLAKTRRHSRRRSGRLLPVFILPALVYLGGCQEDGRAAQTSIGRSAELTESRLDQVTGDFLETFGNPKSADDQLPGPDTARELTWNAPLTREDGSALPAGHIAGFRIYFRLRHQQAFRTIAIRSSSITRYSLEGLPPGAYEFAITTVDVYGRESRRSAPVLAEVI